MKVMGLDSIWQRCVEKSVRQVLDGTVLSGFNPNVDVLVRITPESIRQLVTNNPNLDVERISVTSVGNLTAVNTPEDFVAVLIDRLISGKSLLMVGENRGLFSWMEEQFPERSFKLGGQAGIMANQMAALNATSVLYSPIMSPKQARVIDENVLFPVIEGDQIIMKPVQEAARPEDPTRSPWVFEYAKGEEFDFGFCRVTTPRANRIIIVTRIPGLGMNFKEEFYPFLGLFAQNIDVAMVAGYHLGGPDPANREAMRYYFRESARALRIMKDANPRLKIHLEYVPMKEADMEVEMLRAITKEVNSFGINEAEIRTVLALFGHEDLSTEISQNERAYSIYQGALSLMHEFGVERVHVHNLGYYVVILRKPYPVSPEKVRQACLYGSCVNAHRALHGGYVKADEVPSVTNMSISEVGLQQLRRFADELNNSGAPGFDRERFLESGVADLKDHFALVIPTHIVPNPAVTVGMGDTISSSSYAMEVIGRD